MIYLFDKIIPAGVLSSDPQRFDLKITKGLVYKIDINFPSGSFGLAGVRILDGGHQVWPSTPGTWFRGDNTKIAFDDMYLKNEAPFIFVVEVYNEDDTFEHNIFVRLGMASKKVFMARFMPSVSYEYYKEMLQEMEAEQKQADQKRAEEVLSKSIF